MRDHAHDHRGPLSVAWRADDYERGRPAMPPSLLDGLFADLGLDARATVLDLAAGTGKLTRLLRGRAGRVIAVEPDPEMRRVFGGDALDGRAEEIPLPDGSVDAVFVAEAWHWFDADRALDEVRRVLRPGGGLALLWNVPREEIPLGPLRELVVEAATPKRHSYYTGTWREPVERALGALTPRTADHDHDVAADDYVAMIASWSFVGALPDDERERLLRGLRAELPDRVTVPFRAEAWVSRGSPA